MGPIQSQIRGSFDSVLYGLIMGSWWDDVTGVVERLMKKDGCCQLQTIIANIQSNSKFPT